MGGAFVALSMVGGGDILGDADADFDADINVDLDADLDIEADFDADIDADIDADTDTDFQIDTDLDLARSANRKRRRIPGWLSIITSFKFWTFGGCFFGLTGLVLSWVEPNLPVMVGFAIALAMGVVCGGGLVSILRSLKNRQVNSLVRSKDFAGLMGTVELPFNASSKGKVVLEVGGSTLHLVAQTDEERDFNPGDSILVVGRSQNRLWVVSAENSLRQQEGTGNAERIE
ncbi:MAG: hypothetical protein AAFO84_16685 [Cyanobacteria bacterium J06598_1]